MPVIAGVENDPDRNPGILIKALLRWFERFVRARGGLDWGYAQHFAVRMDSANLP